MQRVALRRAGEDAAKDLLLVADLVQEGHAAHAQAARHVVQQLADRSVLAYHHEVVHVAHGQELRSVVDALVETALGQTVLPQEGLRGVAAPDLRRPLQARQGLVQAPYVPWLFVCFWWRSDVELW